MSYFYSKTTGGFYPEAMKSDYPDWPADAIPVKDSDYEQLFEGQAKGKIITANESGYPVLSDPPPPTQEQLLAAAEYKRSKLMAEATQTIDTLQDAVDLDMATDDEKQSLASWKKYRVLLSRVDCTKPTWPERPD
ncbi:virus tail fibre assembly protein, lambda gpK [Izhakiella capsodis]|uniref:Virus tail fibre assembly protein, lambda gpK n=1 Tax=Izhakiella capsodis TaxID=1367852 RepID=A0A1I5BC60_9GAMM|nr:tail fiber assembly protein [Izhakiella capsodis]SFN72295.1 virus tail fibre assembly protein, lambda gpK [Izhakiella capsodis]